MSFNKKSSAKRRRSVVLDRLTNQLKTNLKPFKSSDPAVIPSSEVTQLTDGDKRRINKEIITLKERI